MKTLNIHNNTLYITHSTCAFIKPSWVHNRDAVVRDGSDQWWWTSKNIYANACDWTPAKLYFSQDTCSDLERAYQECLAQLIIEE